MKKVLIAANISNDFAALLLSKGYTEVLYNPEQIDYDVQGIVTSTKLCLDSQMLEKFGHLKWIARLGSGMEIIDRAFCTSSGIRVASSPAGIANAVGEHCVGMMVGLLKNIAKSYYEIQHGYWLREPNRGKELEGLTVGLIGYGHTGQAFAQKLKGFGLRILAYDKYKTGFADEQIEEVQLKVLQKEADIISFHVPANQETKHYYNSAFLAECNAHYVLNTSRGDIVDTDILLSGLASGKVKGAALDVLSCEQYLQDKHSPHWRTVEKLLTYNTILTPHIAGYSIEAIHKMSAELMLQLSDII